jgi:hypothetical protein
MDIEMQIMKAYFKENKHFVRNSVDIVKDLLYDAVKRHQKNGYLFIPIFLDEVFYKFPVMTYCRRDAYLISLLEELL